MPCSADAGPRDPAEHLREVFYRMGLDDKVCMVLKLDCLYLLSYVIELLEHL